MTTKTSTATTTPAEESKMSTETTTPETTVDLYVFGRLVASGTRTEVLKTASRMMIAEEDADIRPSRLVVKLEFERDTCSRCGGTGEYPSACWGGMCIKCSRRGTVMTRKGSVANGRMVKWQQENLRVQVRDLVAGDRIMMTDYQGRSYSTTVVSVTETAETIVRTAADRTTSTVYFWSVEVTRGYGMSAEGDHMVTRAWDRVSLTRCYNEVLSRLSGAIPTWTD